VARYASDIQKNTDRVKAYLKAQDDYAQIASNAYRVAEEALEYSNTFLGRKDVANFVIKNAYDLATWKALVGTAGWLEFVINLRSNRVVERDLVTIRQAVNSQFEIILSDVEYDSNYIDPNDRTVEIEVKSFTVKKGARGIVIHYEPLDDVV
jgi:hypothetical protein